MNNLLDEEPFDKLSGRRLATIMFIDDVDINNKKVLDIGCGYGWCEHNILKRGASKVVGIEASEKDLVTIKKHLLGDEKLELQVASATCLPFKENSFDTIMSWEVIEHIPYGCEKLMFSEVERVLKPDGVFYLSAPHKSLFANILDPAWLLLGHRHYSRLMLESFGKDASFNADLVEIKGGWWSLIFALNMYIAKWIFRRRPFGENFFGEKEAAEYMGNDGFANIFIKFRKSI